MGWYDIHPRIVYAGGVLWPESQVQDWKGVGMIKGNEMIVGRRPHRTLRRIKQILHINCGCFSREMEVYSVLLVGVILPPTTTASQKIRYMGVYATLRSNS